MKQAEMKDIIENDPFICRIKPCLSGEKVFLAGGFIRDLYLKGTGSKDRDLVLFDADTEKFSRNLADFIGGAFVELDGENQIYRVVLGDEYFDIAQGLEDNVDKDIDRRDFCINSIFYDFSKGEFYDKNGGFEDLRAKKIRTCNIENLKDDPLRMFRAYRFQAQLGFEVDKEVRDFVCANARSLDTVAKERVNQEILKMFEGDFLTQTLLEMFDIGLLEVVFPFIKNIKKIPPNTHHHLDLVHHSIETLNNIRMKKPLLRLAALYHDIGKPECWTIEEDTGRHRFIGHDEKGEKLVLREFAQLKFSKKQAEYVSKLVRNHIYPSSLMADGNVTDRAIARFIRKIHPDVEDLIELARADRLSARGEAVSDEMVEVNLQKLNCLLGRYEKVKDRLKELPKLLCGGEIMDILGLKPGPSLGKVIEELKEAQISGEVQDKAGAIEFVKKFKGAL